MASTTANPAVPLAKAIGAARLVTESFGPRGPPHRLKAQLGSPRPDFQANLSAQAGLIAPVRRTATVVSMIWSRPTALPNDLAAARARSRRRRYGISTAAALVIHVGFALAVLWSANGSSFSGGAGASGGDGDAVMVSLVGPTGQKVGPDAPSAAEQAQFDALMQRVREPTPDALPVDDDRRRGDAGKLLDEIAKAHGGGGEGGDAAQQQSAGAAQKKGRSVEGAASERGDKGHAQGDVWGELQTCWKPEAGVPVTLEVVIDSHGGLALPPKVLRPQGAVLSVERLRAEVRAIQAVAGCAPFRSGVPMSGVRTYRFEFAARGAAAPRQR
jgi:hypothetical protein